METFDIKTKIYFGDNALDHLCDLPYRKVFVITDPFVVKSGMAELILSRLKKAGAETEVFDGVVPDPPISEISKGVEQMLAYGPDAVVAVGGGSAIDSAKSIREIGSRAQGGEVPPLIAIPTTSGTGSEVTRFSVITDPDAGKKYPLVADELLPDEAILDAELVRTVPPGITADTGMDVLTHAMEAYVSSDANEFSSALAEKAVEICGAFLLRSYFDQGDTHARKKMHVASCLAGLAFNSASLGLNHGIAHTLGAHFHIPHGRANAIVLPHIIEFNSDINEHSRSRKEYLPSVRKYIQLAKLLGLNNFNEITTVRALTNWVQFMLKEMNMPLSVAQCGVDRDSYFAKLDDMAESALADSCTATNPRRPSKEDVLRILKDLYGEEEA